MHVCNDVGGWGRGFVLALSKRWSAPEDRYREWYRGEASIPFELGQVHYVAVEPELWVANLIGQHDIRSRSAVPPIRYDAIRDGLQRVAAFAQSVGACVHMPRIGAGLAGGRWEIISTIIDETLVAHGIAVTVYDLPAPQRSS